MNQNNFMRLKVAIYEMGLLFNQPPSDDRINAYAKLLANFEPHQVIYAFKQVIKSGNKFFPSMAEILSHLQPPKENAEDTANLIANEIIQKCIEKGRYNTGDIVPELSGPAQAVIKSSSYLIMNILNSDDDTLPIVRAHIRGLAKAMTTASANEEKRSELSKIGINPPVPGPQKLDYKSYLPDEVRQ